MRNNEPITWKGAQTATNDQSIAEILLKEDLGDNTTVAEQPMFLTEILDF